MSIPRSTQPKFTVTLPATKKEVKYRPFLVKEEKLLLVALEEQNDRVLYDAIQNLVLACTFDTIDINTIPQVDAEFLFLNIRNKSMTTGFTVTAKCGCGCHNEVDLDMSKVSFENLDEKSDGVIVLDDETKIKLDPPTIPDTVASLNGVDLIAKCIRYIEINGEIFDCGEEGEAEVVSWLNDLPKPQLETIDLFFEKLPKMIFDSQYMCMKCGETNKIHLEGLESFFG